MTGIEIFAIVFLFGVTLTFFFGAFVLVMIVNGKDTQGTHYTTYDYIKIPENKTNV